MSKDEIPEAQLEKMQQLFSYGYDFGASRVLDGLQGLQDPTQLIPAFDGRLAKPITDWIEAVRTALKNA